MNILITGGSGFVGSNLAKFLLVRGHQVIAIGRSEPQQRFDRETYRFVAADTTRKGPWQKELADADAVVNLAGATIFKRWTEKYKKKIYDSRVLTTRNVVEALPSGTTLTLCSASGAGYYGSRGDDVLNEDERPGRDFLAGLSMDWEKEALRASAKGARVAVLRFGVVLGKNGGAMAKLIPAFKLFVGGPLGDGQQWFPWLHLDDLMAAMVFVLEHPEVSGPLNFCAPNPVRNRELAQTLGEVLSRPSFMPAPAFMIRLALGEFGDVFLGSQRTIPDKLVNHGFSFQYPDIRGAIRAIVEG
ncbi:TIGR01777 family oxidoreductase [Thermodesulfobacteriota bacterium]